MILAISFTTLLLTQAPHVELDFHSMGSGNREGKRFAEIAPVDQNKRIVRVNETGFARDSGPLGEQAAYDALVAHLLDSKATAKGWALSADEARLADLFILTKEGEILCIEVVGTSVSASSPNAILIHGKGRGARISVRGFKHPDRKR
jgi:hypothetical protein